MTKMNDLCSPPIQEPVSTEAMNGSDTLPPQPKGLADPVILNDHLPEPDREPSSLDTPAVNDTTPVDSDTDLQKDSFSAEDSYYKYQSHEHSNSSEIGSHGDPEELSRRSPPGGEYIDDRGIDISQRLPSNLGQYSSPFSAEEARLRFSLESSQIRDRYSHLNSTFADEARRRFSLPADASRPDLPPLTPNSSSPPTSPDLSRSPYTPYKGQGQGTPRSLDRSFDDQDYALVANVKEGLYFCHLCSFSGTTQKDFDQHMTVHFEHVCPHCDYKSRTEGRLKRHIKDFHTEDSDGFGTRTMPGRPKIFRCKQCEYSTTDKIEFWSHSRTHIKEDKLLQCPRCPFVTEYKHHLEYHLRNHFGSKPFKCPKCNYACVNKSMLNSHMKSHTNVYQYRCADCTYATKYCHSLKLHLRKYNHKPAAVLNSDGSLPQGVDATASGLSLLAKRGPPRGPRGPRKDKLDGLSPGFPQLPPGLPGPMPGLPGMISPFWPMLHGLPNGLPSPLGLGGLGPRFAPQLPGLPGFGLKTEDLTSPPAGSNTYKCNFCSFVAANRDVLTSHVMKVHAGDNQDLFSIFGISSESILEDKNRMNALNALKSPLRSRLGMYGLSPEFPSHIKKESPEDLHRMPRTSSANGQERRLEKPGYPYLSGKYPSDNVQKDEGIDILKQMTLKFGSGPVEPERKPRAESPLDLTKPRTTPPLSGSYRTSSDLERKRDYEDQSSGENSIHSGDVTTPPPRKRSRKGKAFKLDTLCMKLQEQRTHMYGSDEDSNMEDDIYSSDLLPVESDRQIASAEYDRVSGEEYSREKIDVEANDDDVNDSMYEAKKSEDDAVDKNEEDVNAALKEIHSSLAILNNKNAAKDIESKDKSEYIKDNEEKQEEPTSSQNEETIELDAPKVPSPSHHRRKAVPPAIQRGADIAWRILNNPNLTDPAQIMRNGSNGHSLELSPLDKKLWINAPDCVGDMSKGEYECPHCQIAFGDCIMYTMHMGYHGYKDPYKCNMCGDTCKDRVEFFLHIARAAHN